MSYWWINFIVSYWSWGRTLNKANVEFFPRNVAIKWMWKLFLKHGIYCLLVTFVERVIAVHSVNTRQENCEFIIKHSFCNSETRYALLFISRWSFNLFHTGLNIVRGKLSFFTWSIKLCFQNQIQNYSWHMKHQRNQISFFGLNEMKLHHEKHKGAEMKGWWFHVPKAT